MKTSKETKTSFIPLGFITSGFITFGFILNGFIILTFLVFGFIMISPTPIHADWKDDYDLYVRRQNQIPSLDVNTNRQNEHLWAYPEHVPDEFPIADLKAYDAWRDIGYLRRAISEYKRGSELWKEFLEKCKDIQNERFSFENPVWWKEIERQERLTRKQLDIERKYSIQVSELLIRCETTLNKIGDTQIRNEREVVNMKQAARRLYGTIALRLSQPLNTIHTLEEYLREQPTRESEWPLHYYLARAYTYVFNAALQDTGITEFELRKLRTKRNIHYLRAVELKFGSDSLEYRVTDEKIKREEMGSPRSSW